MKAIYATALETFLTLRRDKIFYPALIITAFIFVISSFVAEWSVDDWRIIFFNFSQTLFRLAGDIIALLFGTKLLQDAKADGSIETSLSRPISRPAWVLGKYLGLASCLVLFGVAAGGFWVFINYAYDMGTPYTMITWGISLAILEWLCVGALAIFFSTFTSFGSALFASAALWVLGLLSGAIATSFNGSNEGFHFVSVVKQISLFWNFDRFTLIHYSREMSLPSLSFLVSVVGYGLSVCASLLTLASLTVNSRDAIK